MPCFLRTDGRSQPAVKGGRCTWSALHPKPSILDSQPSTLNPKVDAASGKLRLRFLGTETDRRPRSVAFSVDGTKLASVCLDAPSKVCLRSTP